MKKEASKTVERALCDHAIQTATIAEDQARHQARLRREQREREEKRQKKEQKAAD
jgi:hypothetical protein